jgi:hypothetical protein
VLQKKKKKGHIIKTKYVAWTFRMTNDWIVEGKSPGERKIH